MFTAEGVLAVIEVKMTLDRNKLDGIVENCRSVTSLKRRAYLPTPVKRTQLRPILYSVFAFEANRSFAVELTELMATIPTHEQIASVCYLNWGVDTHILFEGKQVKSSPKPTEVRQLATVQTANALLLWFTSLSTVIFQDQHAGQPVDLLQYARDETTHLEAGFAGQSLEQQRRLIRAGLPGMLGAEAQFAEAIYNAIYIDNRDFTAEEEEALLRAGLTITRSPDGEPTIETSGRYCNSR